MSASPPMKSSLPSATDLMRGGPWRTSLRRASAEEFGLDQQDGGGGQALLAVWNNGDANHASSICTLQVEAQDARVHAVRLTAAAALREPEQRGAVTGGVGAEASAALATTMTAPPHEDPNSDDRRREQQTDRSGRGMHPSFGDLLPSNCWIRPL